MIPTVAATLLTLLGLIGVVLWKAWPLLPRWTATALRNLPGPPSPSWFYGNFQEINAEERSVVQERWIDKYGPNIVYKNFLNNDRLYTIDTRALNHILTHSVDYQKPIVARRNLAKVLGEGVLFTEGEHHRRQRRIMNPAFGPTQIRELAEIFVQKSIELRNFWDAQIAQDGEPTARIEICSGLSKMTLDVIGLAGFGYSFNSLNPTEKTNELTEAFQDLFLPERKFTVLMILKNFFPVLDIIPDEASTRVKRAREVMRRVGKELIAEKKVRIQQELAESKEKSGVKRNDLQGRDLLTLLLKANISTDVPDNQRLSDEDVLAQVPTFLAAGHDTTSTATTWCLYTLTQAPYVQKKLRDELFTIETDTPTMDQLNSLPYLDCVVRETLRLYAPVPETMRVAEKDDVIPVSEPFVDRFGQVQDNIRISKGASILIPILALNRSKKYWGEDAHEFKPERWESPSEAAASVPGVWSHLLTFLGGPRACIGYRFSVVETKALIFVLVRAFEFALAVPPEEIEKKTSVVQRPQLRSAPERGAQMPLLVKRYTREL
uniref:Cytochrome P450 monooxygenase n=1 Tax=Trametes versicolor TaxID=5325 RepID=A0AA86MBR1_TRAVE|nr:cytochrome P450 monooxygenase [Trametes versicolor]